MSETTLDEASKPGEVEDRSRGFGRFAAAVASLSGRPATFALACGVIAVWGVSRPLFRWSDTWQLVRDTRTTIVTFPMVVVIRSARNRRVGIEDMNDDVVERRKNEFSRRASSEGDRAGREGKAE